MEKVILQIDSLDCPSCIDKIEQEILSQEGIDKTRVLYNTSKIRVDYDVNKISCQDLRETIERLGYRVVDVISIR